MDKKVIMSTKIENSGILQSLTIYPDESLAYIKQELMNNAVVWSIYNFQGEKMGYAASREVAFAVANQNAYIGMSVH